MLNLLCENCLKLIVIQVCFCKLDLDLDLVLSVWIRSVQQWFKLK